MKQYNGWDAFNEFADFIEKLPNSETIVKAVLFCGCTSIVNGVWTALEILVYGNVRPEIVDTIIGILFAATVYKLLRQKWKINGR